MNIPVRVDRPTALRLARASIVLGVSVAYLAGVFRIADDGFWKAGMGDWMDPYFINALLEHWHHSLWTLSDPSSPPIFFPTRKTLGYSHGLVLYAPFYMPLRLFFHPFQAYNLTLFAVMETGILCVYLLFRKFFNLQFFESFLLAAFFLSSRNVVDGPTSVWIQRASVFLIPPVLLILLASRRTPGAARIFLAGFSGFAAALLFTQDFYTAQFALLFAVLFAAPAVLERRRAIAATIPRVWKRERPAAKLAIVMAALAAAWVGYLWAFGGGGTRLLGLRISSNDWRRPAIVGALGLAVFLWVRGRAQTTVDLRALGSWLLSLAVGGLLGCVVFFWIYLASYREHPSFPEENLLNALQRRDPSRWLSAWDLIRDLRGYDSLRSFALVFAVGILAWVPWFKVDLKTRFYALFFFLVSLVVLLIPLSFNGFSIWRTVFEPLPGFAVIRDPQRIIYLYELAVVLAIGLSLARVSPTSSYRWAVLALVALLIVASPNRQVFAYLRPNEAFDRWVTAPIEIDPSCRSFFVKAASPQYSSRSRWLWMLYSIDSTFVALDHSIPTLNGYSAWRPEGWDLFVPEEAEYAERVRRWIQSHALHHVCELDLDARTMKPYRPPAKE